MADDKRVMAIITAVATNIDRLRQAINGLRQLHDRWKDGNGTFINLIAQLTALKSNISEMQDWMNYAISDLHSQLLMDLDVLMTSCTMLVKNLDALIVQLRQPDHDNIDVAIKLRFVVGKRCMNRLRDVAKRQTDAVSLLLAACKCHHTAQRKILLHKSREIRKQDASGLSTLLKSNTMSRRTIELLTQLSRMIQWCRMLFYAKLQGTSEDSPTQQDYLDAAAAMRSEAIDRQLEEDATTTRREAKIVLFGDPHGGKELIMRQMQVLYANGYQREERTKYRMAIRSTVRVLMHAIIDLLRDTGVKLTRELNRDFAVLLHEVESADHDIISPEAVLAVQRIWNSQQFSTIYLRNFEIDFPPYAPYFVSEIERLSHPDYIPSESDIVRLATAHGGVKELRFPWGELDVHLFNISGYIPDQFRKRWFHQFDSCTALIFSVDISIYDRPFYGQPKVSQLVETLNTFEGTVNSPIFGNSSIILLLNNFSRFKEKLPHSPLSTFFPDYYEDAEDPCTSARKYLLSRFKNLNRNRLSVYSFWVDLDMSDNQHLYAALKKTLLHIQQRKARSELSSALEDPTSPVSGGKSASASATLTTLSSSSKA